MSVYVSLIVCGIAFVVSLFLSFCCFRTGRYGRGIFIALVLPFCLVLVALLVPVFYNIVLWLLSQE